MVSQVEFDIPETFDLWTKKKVLHEILILGTDVVQDVTTSRFRTCRLSLTV